jgi:hypothetical protein
MLEMLPFDGTAKTFLQQWDDSNSLDTDREILAGRVAARGPGPVHSN